MRTIGKQHNDWQNRRTVSVIPHVNTPKTIERFMSLAKNGLPQLKGLWLLTKYLSDINSAPELIVDAEFNDENKMNQWLRLESAISKNFLYHKWTEHRLKEDVFCEGKSGFDLRLFREILKGRVRRIYLDPSIEREENSNEQ